MKFIALFSALIRINNESQSRLRGSFFKAWRNILAGFAVWTIYGIFAAWISHVQTAGGPKPLSWKAALAYDCGDAYIFGLLSPLAVFLARRFRLERPRVARNLAIHCVGALCFAAINTIVIEAATVATGFHREPLSMPGFLKVLNWGMFDGVPLYWLIIFVFYAADYYRQYQSSLVAAADLNAQLARAQLQSLKMQLHPHFLFNTLHAISELIHEDPVAAERMIIGLSQLLRLSLENSSVVEVPLEQELRFTQLYLDIEKMRFDERLQIEIDIDEDARYALVPNLILQPLVENAIKHGISKRAGNGRIVLSAKRDGGFLILSIRDNGAGMDAENGPPREGIGLGTTRARLDKLYGTNQSFHFLKRKSTGAEAVIRIPWNTKNAEITHEHVASANR